METTGYACSLKGNAINKCLKQQCYCLCHGERSKRFAFLIVDYHSHLIILIALVTEWNTLLPEVIERVKQDN